MVFWMKYEHQINWANTHNNNLDDCTGRSVQNAWIVLLSTLTLNLSRNGWKIRRCTSYNRKNWNNSYDFLQITRVHALLHSVYFKPTFVDYTSVIGMLALSAVCHHRVCVCCVFVLFSRFKKFPILKSFILLQL